MPKATTTLGSSEIADRLKIDAKKLRKIIRLHAAKKPTNGRYEFRETDIHKLRELIDEHTRSEETAKAAKKSKK